MPDTAGQGSRGADRHLTSIVLVNAIGNGLFFTVSALYFTRIAGITPAALGLGMTAGGACGAAAAMLVGHLAQRWGPRMVTVCIWLLEAVCMLGYTQVRSFATFFPLVCVVLTLDRSAGSAYRVLIGQVLTGENRNRARSFLRAVANVGMGSGATLGALVLESDTRTAYDAAIIADTATFVIAASLLSSYQAAAKRESASGGTAQAKGKAGRTAVFRDRPFLAVTALSMVLTLQFALLEVGLPLWVAGHTRAPHATVAAALILNTAMVALLQVRMSKGTEDLMRAARLTSRSGVLLAAGCLVFALAAGLPGWAALAVVLAAAILQTFAEIYFSIGTMALSYDLVPEESAGAYHGVFQSGYVTGLLIAPVVITNTALRFGTWGWLSIAVLFAVAGALVVPAGRAALRARAAAEAIAAPA